jgi:hypothetical protein
VSRSWTAIRWRENCGGFDFKLMCVDAGMRTGYLWDHFEMWGKKIWGRMLSAIFFDSPDDAVTSTWHNLRWSFEASTSEVRMHTHFRNLQTGPGSTPLLGKGDVFEATAHGVSKNGEPLIASGHVSDEGNGAYRRRNGGCATASAHLVATEA